MNRIVSLFFLLLSLQTIAQRDFLVVFEGQVKDLLDQQNLYGVYLDVMQQDAILTKVITDERGVFYASARIQQGIPVQLRLTKGAYLTKLIDVDLSTMQGMPNNRYGTQLIKGSVFTMYKLKPDADLNFASNKPTDKFIWSATDKKLLREEKLQKEYDDKAKDAYQNAINQQIILGLLRSAVKYDAPGSYDKALPYYDSILNMSASHLKAMERKTFILKTIKDEQELAQKKSQQLALLTEAQMAKSNGDLLLADQKIKAADQILPGNSMVQAEKLAISNLQNEKKQQSDKQKAFQIAWNKAQSAFTNGNSKLAIQLFSDAEKIKPDEKPRIEQEIQKIKNTIQDKETEKQLTTILNAAELQFKNLKGNITEKQLMDILEKYKQADKLIATFHKQILIDQYSKKLQTGMKLVTDKLENLSTVYQSQLAKAIEYYENDQLELANKILEAPAMQSRQNEPAVVELQNKIKFRSDFNIKNIGAYRTLKEGKDKQVALLALEDAYRFGKAQENNLKTNSLSKLQKSIDSLKIVLNPVKPTNKEAQQTAIPAGITLSAPGEAVSNGSQAFNDLYQTRMTKEESPYRQQQEIKNQIDYKNYFENKDAEIKRIETGEQLQVGTNVRELNEKQYNQTQQQLQENFDKGVQQIEFEVMQRNNAASTEQQKNAQQIQAWKDAKDYQTLLETKEQKLREQNSLSYINEAQNIRELQQKDQEKLTENKSIDMAKKVQDLDYTKQQQHIQSEKTSVDQQLKIQQIASSRVELQTTPNYLRDENGVLFPNNSFTEKTYQIKNKEGFVTKVVIRRVVVDPNGHGVVYEQTTDESGRTFFTRDAQVCTEYIWFNESKGANVLKK